MKTQIITDDVFYVDIIRFCETNNIQDVDEFVSKCMVSGFYVEKYGMLNSDVNLVNNEPKEKIVEVFVDRVVEIIKEVPVYKEVIREVPSNEVRVEIREVEVVKEVPVIKEVYVLKEIPTSNPALENELNETKLQLTNLSIEVEEKNRIIQGYRAMFEASRQTARYHKSSNIKIS